MAVGAGSGRRLLATRVGVADGKHRDFRHGLVAAERGPLRQARSSHEIRERIAADGATSSGRCRFAAQRTTALKRAQERDESALVVGGQIQAELMARNGALFHARAAPARRYVVVAQARGIEPVLERRDGS